MNTSYEPKLAICEFNKEHFFLSNFFPCKIVYDGETYPSTENAYQAAKCPINERFAEWEKFQTCSAAQSKKLGRTLSKRADWDTYKFRVMEDVLRLKFEYKTLQDLLYNTRPYELIEGNTWGDTCWGVCNGVGTNHLGKLLMKIRTEIIFDRHFTQES